MQLTCGVHPVALCLLLFDQEKSSTDPPEAGSEAYIMTSLGEEETKTLKPSSRDSPKGQNTKTQTYSTTPPRC